AELTFNIVTLGAKPDEKSDASPVLQTAWAKACDSSEPATIYIPEGIFFVRSVRFNGPCKNNAITVLIDGTLVASSDIQSLQINDGKNVNINGLSSINSQLFSIVMNRCQNVHMTRVNVLAAGDSPNTDGIHVRQSSDVTILNSNIENGDDCISIGPWTSNMWIESITCGPRHGISIGSLGMTFTRTRNGVRIKSWGRPSNGFATNVHFQHIIMNNVKNPIIIDQNYCRGQDSGVKVSEVTYEDIKGTSATEIAINFDCSPTNHCTGLSLIDIKLTYENHITKASCKNAEGTTFGVVEPSSCLASANFYPYTIDPLGYS
ncbi:polygalacturonase-like, partial [Cucurbita maxima]|uniref:Polygalacturonase-like n=1 Tax=Cucurbita maxima TaxID=3661 RepID=A0A6J1IBV1_CUCMA